MKTKKIYRNGQLKEVEVIRAATKEDGYSRGFWVIGWTTEFGSQIFQVVHKSLFRN